MHGNLIPNLFGHLEETCGMKAYGLIGDQRVHKSLSPVMFESVFAALGSDAKYLAFNIDGSDLQKAIQAMKQTSFAGVNVTVPYKQAVIPYLDDLSECASQIGAVNTITFDEESAVGCNTDGGGFSDLLDYYGLSLEEADICILGAGGASRAVLQCFIDRGCSSIIVVNRTYQKSLGLCAQLGGTAVPFEDAMKALEASTIVVNTTSISDVSQAREFLKPFSDHGRFKQLRAVIDINYGRKGNFWRQLAQSNDARFVDGLYMLAAQARRSFLVWTGQTIDIGLFLKPLGFKS